MIKENVTKRILNLIRQRIFHFIWACAQEVSKFHLVSWETLSLPKSLGGWVLMKKILFW